MKRLMLIALALLVAPAMADVTISVVDNGDLTADIVVTADGDDATADGSLVAGIGIDVTVDAPSAATIDDVTGYKESGESMDGDEGYGIYLGTILIEGDAITDVGTPVAPDTDPGSAGALGTGAITLEFGALFDQAVPEATPLASTKLCTIEVSEGCTVTITANQTRGGVVLIGGGDASNVVLDANAAITGPSRQYAGPDQAAYDEYIAAGKTEAEMDAAWARPYQCAGDVRDDTETFFNYRVYISDLNAIITNWKGVIGTVDPAADVDHESETFFNYRCYIGDLNTVIGNWKATDATLAGDCNTAP